MDPNDAQMRAQSELQSGESLCWAGLANPGRPRRTSRRAFRHPVRGLCSLLDVSSVSLHTRDEQVWAQRFRRWIFRVPPFWPALPPRRHGDCPRSSVDFPQSEEHGLWRDESARHRHQRIQEPLGKIYTPADIVNVEHRERPDGSGDIVLMTNMLARSGNNMASQVSVTLRGVPNVKQVADQVIALHAQAQTGPG